VGKGAKRRAHDLSDPARDAWARFRLRSSSYGGQAALPTPRQCRRKAYVLRLPPYSNGGAGPVSRLRR